MKKLRVEIDPGSGFCSGVVNAISLAESSLAAGNKVASLGDIVHNSAEVRRLDALGLRSVGHDQLGELAGKSLLIRAHGEPPSTYERAEELGVKIIDATCPVVAALQRVVAKAWSDMESVGGQVVILGKHGHAEVVGLAGQTAGNAIVVEGVEDLDAVDFERPIFFLSQTTQSLELFAKVRDEIIARSVAKVTVKDTICRRVSDRETHLREFASRFDVVIFVAGRKSSNGKVLFEVCRSANPKTYLIEDSAEINEEWFIGATSVGICGATSTPQWQMEEVANKINYCSP